MVNGELIVDSFAGGGVSTGIEMALGVSPDIAINHDPEALAMHAANHPHTEHHCENVWKVEPRKVCRGRPVGFFWLSPDCTYHSKARGGKPFRDRNEARGRRGLPWLAVYWAEQVRPRIIGMENVEELAEWGPLLPDGSRNLDKAGFNFRRLVKRLQNLGYEVDWRVLHAHEYGVPTIRKRLVLLARCDGLPLVWPERTHGPGLLPYRTAAECIDFTRPCPSIFGRAKPLVPNTERRIYRGIQRYMINDPNPFIVGIDNKSNGAAGVWPSTEPLRTITTVDHHALVTAFLLKYYGSEQDPQLREPLHTITTKDRFGLVMVRGEPHKIVDIGMRMLTPRELFNAQGFPPNYVIDLQINGRPLPKHAQTRMCGNSAPPGLVAAPIRANFLESGQRETRQVYA